MDRSQMRWGGLTTLVLACSVGVPTHDSGHSAINKIWSREGLGWWANRGTASRLKVGTLTLPEKTRDSHLNSLFSRRRFASHHMVASCSGLGEIGLRGRPGRRGMRLQSVPLEPLGTAPPHRLLSGSRCRTISKLNGVIGGSPIRHEKIRK